MPAVTIDVAGRRFRIWRILKFQRSSFLPIIRGEIEPAVRSAFATVDVRLVLDAPPQSCMPRLARATWPQSFPHQVEGRDHRERRSEHRQPSGTRAP